MRSHLRRFLAATFDVQEASNDILVTSFSQELREGEFYTSLAKKAPHDFGDLLQRATKYIDLEKKKS